MGEDLGRRPLRTVGGAGDARGAEAPDDVAEVIVRPPKRCDPLTVPDGHVIPLTVLDSRIEAYAAGRAMATLEERIGISRIEPR